MGADMELVRQFNAELSSIYEGKPPISKAKMGAITRYAVKALKYYKHVVHSVEKFIQKCHTEYKVPALYVLDSIIRQSRHQFGPEKDLFGPRFQKNIKLLFQYIYLCPAEDKPKIVRVLNLWQKNGIYTPEVISPLINMASASQKSLQAAISKHKKAKAAAQSKSAFDNDGPTDALAFDDEERVSRHSHKKRKGISVSQDDEIKVLKAQLEQQKKLQELLQQQLQMQMMQTKQQTIQLQLQQQEQLRNKLQDQMGPGGVTDLVDPDVNIMNQIQDLQKQLERDKIDLASLAANKNNQEPVQHHPEQGNSGNANENTTQFLENFQQLIQNAKGIVGNSSKDPRHHGIENLHKEAYDYTDGQDQMNSSFQATQSPERRRGHGDNFSNNNDGSLHGATSQNPYHNHNVLQPLPQKKPLLDWEEEKNNMAQHMDDDAMQIDNDDYEPPFHDVLQQHQLEQQREDPRVHNENQTESTEAFEERKRQQKEIEKKQRDKRLLPSPRHRRVTVASVTVWVGRLPKSFNSDILKSHFHEYAEVKHIDYIESRGCAFVTMASRFDADSALRFLRHKRIENVDVKLNWGKTKVLFDYSQFWEENVGCAFIPWEIMNEQILSTFLDTCIIDEDTVPPGMSIIPPKKEEEIKDVGNEDQTFQIAPPAFIPGFPPAIFPPAGLIPPIPPPGFRGQMPPIPPGIIPPNILQFTLNRPPGQNLSEGGVVVHEPRFEGRQEQPQLNFNNLRQQPPRPPLMQNQHTPFNNRDGNHQPRPSLLRPPIQREEQPHPQPTINIDEPQRHMNPRFPMNRPPPRHELRLDEQQRPQFDGRVPTGNLRFQLQSQPRFQLSSHQPQLEVRSQHGIPTIGFKQDERKEEKCEVEKPWEKTLNTSNIPTTAFLLNLVNQQKEKQDEERKNERTDRSHRDKSPERDDDRDRRGRDRYDRRDRDRDRSDYRKRDRSYERGRRSRDRGRDERRNDRERERSGDRRNNRDRSSEWRTERDRRDRYGRDRDEDRYRGNDRSNERNVDKSREQSSDRSRERSKQSEEFSQDKQSSKTETEQIEHLKKENKDQSGMDRNDEDQQRPKEESNDTSIVQHNKIDSSPQVEKLATPPNAEDDLYDPMDAMNSPEEETQADGEQTLEDLGNEKPLQMTTERSLQKGIVKADEHQVDFPEEEITEEPSESPIFPIANNEEDQDEVSCQETNENAHAEEKSRENNEVTAN